ncbi:thiamine pyrophosphate-binding protein [Chitinophaga ginsengisoli]|uniref:N2-(2-carboxyethyl)arginine synthase n=1 Tax=Chitinophaga ginsengisoli TaxID=363837 RepID=A0A2P8GQC6_9BACT|nr:thiamine pyrophosphate-binding protein [Chitinophaga ginsengisoli]PSL36171.1 N2-(2-carboxyethyl)arginine synthase [Chitinophaga ginsengisoli]
MKASKLFLKSVAKLGIRKVFGIVGGEAQAMQFDEEPSLDFYLTRHEFAAGIMADVFGRMTGEPQMCYSTFGPGLSNLSTGIVSAILDRSPMLAVSAQIPRAEIQFNQTHQCIDNVALMRPITKFAAQIENVLEIPALLKTALEIAVNDIPGPVYLSFPTDVMEQEIPDAEAEALLQTLSPIKRNPAPLPDFRQLDVVLSKIKAAEKPLVIVGNQLIRDNCCEELVEFINAHNIPVISTLASKGIIPEDHPLFITTCNKYVDKIYHDDLVSQIFDNSDLLLLIGYDFGEDLKSSLWKNKKETIVINTHYNDMGTVFQPDTLFTGDLKQVLPYIMQQGIAPKEDNEALLELKQLFDKRAPFVSEEFSNIPLIIQSVRNALGESGVLCSDIGLHKQYAGLLSKTYKPDTFMCSNVCGTFGFGLPAGLGAKLARPAERVAVICGDGGFHSTSQDLETAVRYNIPVVIVVLKDNAFGLIKYYQFLEREEIFKRSVEFGNVDFVKLAEANGMKSIQLEAPEQLEALMELAFSTNKPMLIEIPIVYDYRFREVAVPEEMEIND